MVPRYSMIIQWSEEDKVYLATLPEFDGALTHGSTYEEAAKMGAEVIETFIELFEADGKPLPKPHEFIYEERLRTPIGATLK